MIYIKHLIRWFKKLFRYPFQFLNLLLKDLKKDHFPDQNKENNFIFVIGMPKSGSTLIEEIISELGYVDLTNSFLRIYDDSNLAHPHQISNQMFSRVPKNKNTFLKTHTHYDHNALEVIKKYKPKIILSVRNIKDMLISRYSHLLNDKKADINYSHFREIIKLDTIEGFKKFITYKDKNNLRLIDYYNDWAPKWIKVIDKNNIKCLILNYEDYVNDNNEYIAKILDYLNIDSSQNSVITKKINDNFEKMKKYNLKENLNRNIKPKTYNKDSKKIRDLLNTPEFNKYFKNLLLNND
jgi:hypothetical protein